MSSLRSFLFGTFTTRPEAQKILNQYSWVFILFVILRLFLGVIILATGAVPDDMSIGTIMVELAMGLFFLGLAIYGLRKGKLGVVIFMAIYYVAEIALGFQGGNIKTGDIGSFILLLHSCYIIHKMRQIPIASPSTIVSETIH